MTETTKEATEADLRRTLGGRQMTRPPRPAVTKSAEGPASAAPAAETPPSPPGTGSANADGRAKFPAPPLPVPIPGPVVAPDASSAAEGQSGLSPVVATTPGRAKRRPKPDETEEDRGARLIREAADLLKGRRRRELRRKKAQENAELDQAYLKFKAYLAKCNAKNPYRRFENLASIGDRAWAKGISVEELLATIDLMKEKK